MSVSLFCHLFLHASATHRKENLTSHIINGSMEPTVLFVLETFGYCCVYLIIEGENLFHQLGGKGIFKAWGKPEFMMLAAAVFLPTCLLRNLSWLAYFSAIGVLSSWLLLIGLLVTGLDHNVHPNADFCTPPSCSGSLAHPCPTDTFHSEHTPQVLGLVMVGYAGHAVFPTLRNDMKDKRGYDQMVDVCYLVT